jgi:hypothetical protein
MEFNPIKASSGNLSRLCRTDAITAKKMEVCALISAGKFPAFDGLAQGASRFGKRARFVCFGFSSAGSASADSAPILRVRPYDCMLCIFLRKSASSDMRRMPLQASAHHRRPHSVGSADRLGVSGLADFAAVAPFFAQSAKLFSDFIFSSVPLQYFRSVESGRIAGFGR